MKGLWIAVATCVLVSRSVKGYDWWEEFQEGIRQYDDAVFNEQVEEETQAVSFNRSFHCPDMSPSPSVPTSVEFVKAADIKVIAALGDSITSGSGANASSVLELPIEYRELSWSIGGYGTLQDVVTLPNILKLFNPNLLGASTGSTLIRVDAHTNITGLNLAVGGHFTYNLPEQTRNLIIKLKSYKGLNFTEDWKLLTIFIGMNDICTNCKDKTRYSADKYVQLFKGSLEMLKNEVPRMIVNVVNIVPMETLREVKRINPGCLLQQQFCSCLVGPSSRSPELQDTLKLNKDYQLFLFLKPRGSKFKRKHPSANRDSPAPPVDIEGVAFVDCPVPVQPKLELVLDRLEELLLSDRFFKKDFAVVLQPFLKHADLPRRSNGRVDFSFFSPDCFHLGVKGQEAMAKGLWNNMFQPVGEKTGLRRLSDPITLICPPVEHPYIYTRPMVVRPVQPQPSSGTPSLTFTFLLLFFHMAVANSLFC